MFKILMMFFFSALIIIMVLASMAYYKESVMTAFVAGSMISGIYVIMINSFKGESNRVVYGIMNGTNKIKVMMKMKEKEEEQNRKTVKDSDDEIVFSDDEEIEEEKMQRPKKLNSTMTVAALFGSIPIAEAGSNCCQSFKLPNYNMVEFKMFDMSSRRSVVTNEWFTPGPEHGIVYVNGTEMCTFSSYCTNSMVKLAVDSFYYIGLLMVFAIFWRVLLYAYQLFRTPVSSVEIEEKLTPNITSRRTKYNYFSIPRLIFVLLYFCSTMTMLVWIGTLLLSTPKADAETKASIFINGKVIDYKSLYELGIVPKFFRGNEFIKPEEKTGPTSTTERLKRPKITVTIDNKTISDELPKIDREKRETDIIERLNEFIAGNGCICDLNFLRCYIIVSDKAVLLVSKREVSERLFKAKVMDEDMKEELKKLCTDIVNRYTEAVKMYRDDSSHVFENDLFSTIFGKIEDLTSEYRTKTNGTKLGKDEIDISDLFKEDRGVTERSYMKIRTRDELKYDVKYGKSSSSRLDFKGSLCLDCDDEDKKIRIKRELGKSTRLSEEEIRGIKLLIGSRAAGGICMYDAREYVLNGNVLATCNLTTEFKNLTMVIDKEKLSKYGSIDKECFFYESILYARTGMSMCHEVFNATLKKEHIIFNPNLSVKINSTEYKERKDQNTKPGTRIIQKMKKMKYKSVMKLALEYNNTILMTMNNMYDDFGEGTFIVEGWSAAGFANPDLGVYMIRNGPMAPCTETNRAFIPFVCSTQRRQMLMCENNRRVSVNPNDNFFICNTDESMTIPNWAVINRQIPYNIEEKEARELDKMEGSYDLRAREGSSTSIHDFSSRINVKLIWGKVYQDNVQQTGMPKYFVYTGLLEVTQSANSGDASFPKMMNRIINTMNRWKTREFNGSIYTMDRAFDATGVTELNPAFVEIFHDEDPNEFLHSQDLAMLNMILKMDIFTENGDLINPLLPGWDLTDPCISGTSTSECRYLVPIFYAIRAYPIIGIRVRFLGLEIEDIGFSSDKCSSVNTIVVNKICYIVDFENVNNDVIVGGYPWTLWSALATSRWSSTTRRLEVPSFYLNHPKASSTQYLSQVSEAANIGYFSRHGRCANVHYVDESLFCDGNPAINLRLVEYSTFHRPLVSMPECHMSNSKEFVCTTENPIRYSICEHDILDGDEKSERECNISVTTELKVSLNEYEKKTVSSDNMMVQMQTGKERCPDCFLTLTVEVGKRCLFCIIIIYIAAGFGYIMLIMFITIGIMAYINNHNLGRLFRWLKIYRGKNWRKLQKCAKCNAFIYNEIEKVKHDVLCKKGICPYCCVYNQNRELCLFKSPSMSNHRAHLKLHSKIRSNPYFGMISVMRTKILAFTLILASTVSVTRSAIIDNETGMRSNRIGSNITISSEKMDCDALRCKINDETKINILMTHNYPFVLKSGKDGLQYTKKLRIENPRLRSSCTYKYSSSPIVINENRIVYSCLGKTLCNYDNLMSLMTNPIAGRRNQPGFIPINPYNPLKSAFCPMMVDCRSPITNFLWLTAGCFTVNDGTSVGHTFITPDLTGKVSTVHECVINSIDYDVCDEQKCLTVYGDDTSINDGLINFEKIKESLPTTFWVATISPVGSTKSANLFLNPPKTGDNSDGTPFSFRMSRIPTGETCHSGTSFKDGRCDINVAGSTPSLNCQINKPILNSDTLMKRYTALSDIYNCNIEDTTISWESSLISRSVTVAGTAFTDSIEGTVATLRLNMTKCNLGSLPINLRNVDGFTLEAITYQGKLKNPRCEGWYNRNNMAMMSFTTGTTRGMIEFHCPNAFSELCVINAETQHSCNVTVLTPGKYTCDYNGDEIILNCTELTYFDSDPVSGNIIGGTGSEDNNTWISGFKIALGSWWSITLITIGSLLILLILIWVIKMVCQMCKGNNVSKYYNRNRRLDEDKEPLLYNKDYYKENKGVRKRNIKSNLNNRYEI